MPRKNLEVAVNELYWRCNPAWLPAERSDQIPPTDEIIGQRRALQAIQTGLGIKSYGYNIYVAGLTGTGKMTTIQKLLEQIDSHSKIPDDICYVYNFEDPDKPLAIYLPAGQGRKLEKDLTDMLEEFSRVIPGIKQNDQFEAERKSLIDRFKRKSQILFQDFEKQVREQGLALMQIQIGNSQRPELFPVFKNEVIAWDKLHELVETKQITQPEAESYRQIHYELMEKLEDIFQLSKIVEAELLDKLRDLRLKFLKPTLNHWHRTLKRKYPNKKLQEHFDRIITHLITHLDDFIVKKEDSNGEFSLANLTSLVQKAAVKDPFLVYRVNVLVDNSGLKSIPIVIETAPTPQNLFGTIEQALDTGGVYHSDFMRIKAGSILQANGGYLVFNFLDAVADPHVWTGLKRVLKNNQIIIQSENLPFALSATAIKPEPIKVNLKMLVIGDYETYRYLFEYDDEFRKIFKIRADFDTEMQNTRQSIKDYARFISKICKDEELLPLDRSGMCVVVEQGARLAERKNRLSTRFSDIADLIRESHYWATQENAELIQAKHVNQAIAARNDRLRLNEEKIQQMILEDLLMIKTTGRLIGQVVGLSIYDMGDYRFGKPSRITAEVALGRSGIINIEREAELSGKIYNKGVLIISGYLHGKYAKNLPLTVNASICFEQSYAGVDGDSASAAEVFALLSSIAQIPIRQDLAVTGSVNQKGEIQPIGGVNEKIEGFYQVCKARGLTGTQGVVIPRQNIQELMLQHEVSDSVAKGKFHIYAMSTIDEGIELLTGLSAGNLKKKDKYPLQSVHGRVQKQLNSFAEKMKEFES